MKFSAVATASAAVLAGSAAASAFALTGGNVNPNFLAKREQSLTGGFGYGTKNATTNPDTPSPSTSGASSRAGVVHAAVVLPAVAVVAGMML